MKLAGTAFKNAEFVELVSQHFVLVLVDWKSKDNKKLVDYYGISTAPMVIYTDPEGEAMKWLTVSLPPSAPEPPRRQRGRATPPAPVSSVPPETAASALSRFELTAATKQFIEERLWTGATLIVSDDGASPRETGLHTDFILLPR